MQGSYKRDEWGISLFDEKKENVIWDSKVIV